MVLEMTFFAVGGLLAGAAADRATGLGPLFLVLLTLLGFGIGILRILRVLNKNDHEQPPQTPG